MQTHVRTVMILVLHWFSSFSLLVTFCFIFSCVFLIVLGDRFPRPHCFHLCLSILICVSLCNQSIVYRPVFPSVRVSV